MIYIFSTLFTLSVISLISIQSIIEFDNLPMPSGPYIIGTQTFIWQDENRPEQFTRQKDDYRKVKAQIWYPAQSKTDSLQPYLDGGQKRIEHISYQLGLPKVLLKNILKIQTNSYVDAKSINNKKFPLIIFSHGLGGMRTQNMTHVEHLVSNGYTVIGIDHSYDANIVYFDDGSYAEYRSDAHMLFNLFYGDTAKYIDKEYSTEEVRDFRFFGLEARTNDVIFVLDQVEKLQMNSNIQCINNIDLEKIGIFGHSYGGATSLYAAFQDDRIDASINLDGWIVVVPETVINNGIKSPFLYIGREEWKNTANYSLLQTLIDNSKINSQFLIMKGTKHFDFIDIPFLSKKSRLFKLSGPIEKGDLQYILNYSIKEYFDANLKGGKNKDLKRIRTNKLIKVIQ